MSSAKEEKGPRFGWALSVFPVSLATGPIGTIVQLYLIEINGVALGTIYGSLATAVYNGVSIPAAIFWGGATDRIHSRRFLIATSYIMTSLIVSSFFFDKTSAGTILRFGVLSFVSAASAAPLNLLIMETEPKSRWATAFAKLSMISSVGNVAGLLLSTLWSEAYPTFLIGLSLPLAVFSLLSAGLAAVMISEPDYVLEGETMALRRPSFFHRLLALPVFFMGVPRLSDFRRAFRGLRSSLTNYIPLFYVSTILFYFSSGLFNSSFVPAMSSFDVGKSEIFSVILVGMVAQTIAFQWAGGYVGKRSMVATSVQGLLLRGWSYVLIGGFALLGAGSWFYFPSLLIYPFASGLAFAVYYTSSNTMMFTTVRRENPGSSLGVYSAIVGVASMGGSLLSGFVSIGLGFSTTFVLSGIILFAAVVVVSRLPRLKPNPEAHP